MHPDLSNEAVPEPGSPMTRGRFLGAAAGAAVAVGLRGAFPMDAVAARVLEEAGGIKSLPKEMQAWYEGALGQPHGPSPLLNFKPKHGPPWKIGYSSPYAGNTWKAGVRERVFNELGPKYKKAGLVSEILHTESNLNNALQIQQIRSLVDQGCDGIFSSSGSSTALNGAIQYAYEHGVPFVMLSGFVTYPNAVNVSVNNWYSGKLQGLALGQKMGGKGDILEVAGILGTAPNDATAKGLREGLKRYPNIKIVGTVAGNWTEPVAQSAVLQWLSTHPGGVQGVATQSPGEEGTLAAFLQSGRTPPPFSLGGVLGPAAYWKAHRNWVDVGYNVWPPGDEGQAGFETLIRILQGQGPLIQSILYPPSAFHYKDLHTVMPAHTPVTSSDWVSPVYGKAFPYTVNVMNKYFKRGVDPLKWKHR